MSISSATRHRSVIHRQSASPIILGAEKERQPTVVSMELVVVIQIRIQPDADDGAAERAKGRRYTDKRLRSQSRRLDNCFHVDYAFSVNQV